MIELYLRMVRGVRSSSCDGIRCYMYRFGHPKMTVELAKGTSNGIGPLWDIRTGVAGKK